MDPFHTLFGIAGLSLLGYGQEYGIAEVDPVFCMPADVVQRMGISTSYCTWHGCVVSGIIVFLSLFLIWFEFL